MPLCRRRSEEVWWTTWAVATPDAEGVGRLSSRSKWGRYRPKFGPLLAPLRCSVAAHLFVFLPLLLAASGNLAANPCEKSLRDLCASPKHPFRPPRNFSLAASISLNTWQFVCHVPEICKDRVLETWGKASAITFSPQFSAPLRRGSLKTDNDEPHTIVRKTPFSATATCFEFSVTSASAIAPLLHFSYNSSNWRPAYRACASFSKTTSALATRSFASQALRMRK